MLGEEAKASHILKKKLKAMTQQKERGGKSPSRLPSQAHSHDSSAHSSPPHSPSNSPTHSRSRSISQLHQGRQALVKFSWQCLLMVYSQRVTCGLCGGSDDKAGSTTGNVSEHKEDEGSTGGGSGGEDSGSKGGSEGEGYNPKSSGSEGKESGSKNKESGSGSGCSSSTPESKEETPEAKPDRVPTEVPSKVGLNASQTPSLPEINDQDSEDEQRSNCYNFACAQDVDFSAWRDHEISESHEEWAKWDKMTCDHMGPHKRVKHLDSLDMPVAYMESRDAFKPIKTSEYGLCHFYQVGVMGDFPTFPEPREPMMSDDICHLPPAEECT